MRQKKVQSNQNYMRDVKERKKIDSRQRFSK